MFDLMYEANGVGLAANQVDLPLRLFVVNLAAKPDEGEELVFINPVVSRPKGSDEREEGCLSMPEVYGPVIRPDTVELHAFTLSGDELNLKLDGMLVRVVQHEVDHLDGILFTDRMTTTGQLTVKPRLDEMESNFVARRKRQMIPDDQQILKRLQELESRYCS